MFLVSSFGVHVVNFTFIILRKIIVFLVFMGNVNIYFILIWPVLIFIVLMAVNIFPFLAMSEFSVVRDVCQINISFCLLG